MEINIPTYIYTIQEDKEKDEVTQTDIEEQNKTDRQTVMKIFTCDD